MAPPISTAIAIDLSRVRHQTVRQLPVRGNSNPLADARFRLLNVLQTSLDLDVILDLFKQELETILRIKGFCYLNETCHVQIKKGESDLHSCAYRLITQNENLGEMIFYRDNRFNEYELDSLEALLSVLLSPVRNSLLYQKAIAASLTDPLTGAGNRQALNSQFSREVSLSRRYQLPLSALMIDIDKFKCINDTYGHATGDVVLKELVKVIGKVNRNTDLCFRYGGEEFVVLRGNTDRLGAEVIATRLCHAIFSNRICSDSGLLQITVSIGVSTILDTDEQDSLLSRADKAMYKVKGMGGNAVAWL
jgi:diguanylate cyclase (GGDEF)-like protein